MSDFSSERSDLQEASRLLRYLSEPVRAGESVKCLIRRASRKADLTYERARSIWYADPRVVVRAGEMDVLRGLAQRQSAASELVELRTIVKRLEALEKKAERTWLGDDMPDTMPWLYGVIHHSDV